MTSGFVAHLVQAYGYYGVFALVALESMGIPLPGETALIAAAVYYSGATHHLNVVVLVAVAASAAVIGDNAGYWIGRTGRPAPG
jgi:membrane protein DedA with SNARE-associated domain